MTIIHIIWEMGSHWRNTELTVTTCWAPAGLGLVQRRNDGGSESEVWMCAEAAPLSVFLGI